MMFPSGTDGWCPGGAVMVAQDVVQDEGRVGAAGAGRQAEVAALMARLADGDTDAVFDLYEAFGAPLAAVMRRHLAAVGVTAAPREDVDGLVIDACLELFECSRAWRPDGGALPWNWAASRLRALAARYVGIHADELDDAAVEGRPVVAAWEGDEGSAHEVLVGLGSGVPMAALLLEAAPPATCCVGSPASAPGAPAAVADELDEFMAVAPAAPV
ncbi:MAG TPA: hypothetical protein PKA98_04060 [Acidimicrobiales bacterium]|nr:hypothetical protein [Acidimicrobiales bacterium]